MSSRCALGAFVLCLLVFAAPAHGATLPGATKAPSGAAFYTPPKDKLAGDHGSVIWSRDLTGAGVLKNASRSILVLYRSRSLAGKAIAVSGSIFLPKGKEPRGGWKVISYGHGTTGIADKCAPTRIGPADRATVDYVNPELNEWLARGYAVARTDYEGLGTPGIHPYAVGHSEGRSVIDIVSAARQLVPSLSRDWIAAGHSQGGQAALFASADSSRWAPALRLLGVAAFAPSSHLDDLVKLAKQVTQPSPLSANGALFLAALQAERPQVDVRSLLTPQASALLPLVATQCLRQLESPSSWGGLAPAQIASDTADLSPFYDFLAAQDPSDLHIRVPTLLMQSRQDTVVFPMFTDQLATALAKNGTKPTLKLYTGADHDGTVKAGEADALAFFRKLSG